MNDLALPRALREIRRLLGNEQVWPALKDALVKAYEETAAEERQRAQERLAVGLPVDASDEELARAIAEPTEGLVTDLGDVFAGQHPLSPAWRRLTLRGQDIVVRRLGGPFLAARATESQIRAEAERVAAHHTRKRAG